MNHILRNIFNGTLLTLIVIGIFLTIVVTITGLSCFGVIYFMMNNFNLIETLDNLLVEVLPLLLCSIGASVAIRLYLFNIGGEGQYIISYIVCSLFSIYFNNLHPVLLSILTVLIGLLSGMLWITIPAFSFKYKNIPVVFTTILMNFITFNILSLIDITASINTYIPHIYLNKIYLLPFVFLILFYIRKRYLKTNNDTLFFSEDMYRNKFLTLFISGMFFGLAGAIGVLTNPVKLGFSVAQDYGFIGLLVAVTSKGNIVVISFISIMLTLINVELNKFSSITHIEPNIIAVVQTLTILVFHFYFNILHNKHNGVRCAA